MKRRTIIALMLTLVAASVHAQTPLKMTFSGNAAGSTVDLKAPNTTTGEEDLAGNGTLGPYSFRMFKASVNVPQLSSTCTSLYFPNVAGAGMFRFEDGSLLFVNLTGGGDCIDPVRMMATCTLTFKISGGTGRFKNASGALTLTETALPVMADSQGNPIFFSEAGEFTGTISGLALEDASRETRQ